MSQGSQIALIWSSTGSFPSAFTVPRQSNITMDAYIRIRIIIIIDIGLGAQPRDEVCRRERLDVVQSIELDLFACMLRAHVA